MTFFQKCSESQYSLSKFTKKPDKWKKHSVLIIVLASVFEKMCPHLIWEFPSYLSRKKGTLGTFLSLGLNISRPWPQKCGLGFKTLSLSSLFSTSVAWKNLKSDEDKVFLRLGKHNYQNKILFFLLLFSICYLLKISLVSQNFLKSFTYQI